MYTVIYTRIHTYIYCTNTQALRCIIHRLMGAKDQFDNSFTLTMLSRNIDPFPCNGFEKTTH